MTDPQSASNQSFNSLGLRFPKTTYPLPPIPKIPSPEKQDAYQSSGKLIRRIAESIVEWRKNLPDNIQPVILAVLQGGLTVNVRSLGEEGHQGIRIDGLLNGQPSMVLAHQATIQLICVAEEIEEEEEHRKIGFYMFDERIDA